MKITNKINFSLLLSVYFKESPQYFNRCMQSIWTEQTIKPDEIVLVEDGNLTDGLYQAISIWKNQLGDTLKIVSLSENKGLGDALDIGLEHCTHELIARMDTDDISTAERFEKQLAILKNPNIDICSAWISEFEHDENLIQSYRKLPEFHHDLIVFSKKRNPMNHPAVMYKKSAVLQAGGYKKMMLFEDYYLWVRMLMTGATFYNIQEVLVKMRAGNAQMERRSGLDYAKKEIHFQKKLLDMGCINFYEFMRNIAIRFTTRVFPKRVIKHIYQLLRN